MKALSMTQPWAMLVALVEKEWETRSWGTRYRGRLAIHAPLRMGRDEIRIAMGEPFRSVLARHGYRLPSRLPRGVVLATCDLVECVQIRTVTWTFEQELSAKEVAFGDFRPGRFAWRLANVRMLPEPVAARGALGLWEFDHPLLAMEQFGTYLGTLRRNGLVDVDGANVRASNTLFMGR